MKSYLNNKYINILYISLCLLVSSSLSLPNAHGGFRDVLNTIRDGAEILDSVTGDDESNDTNVGSPCGRISSIVGRFASYNAWQSTQIGCMIGGTLQDILGKEDQEKLVESTEETITTGNDTSWTNPDSGVHGEVEVTSTEQKDKSAQIEVIQENVYQVPPLDLISAEFRALADSEVYGGPGTNYKIVSFLPRGEQVQVIGKVQGQTWYLISEGGVGVGYVYSGLLEPTGKIGGNKPKPKRSIAKKKVTTKQTCKNVKQKVTLKNGTSKSEELKACPQPDGTWDVA